MSWYDRVWTAAAGIATAVGLFDAVRLMGPFALVGVFLATALVGGATALAWSPVLSLTAPPVILGGPAAAAVLVVTIGLGHLLQLSALWLVTGLVLTSPLVVARVRRRVRPSSAAPVRSAVLAESSSPSAVAATLVVDPQPDLVVPDRMPVSDLCEAWRSSFVALQRATSVESRMRVVRMRELYLDELERRNPDALTAWLHGGARAASDPSRHWGTKRRRHLR